MVIVFIYVLDGNLQWNSWIFKMIDYLKDSIVKFKLNFEKALENKCGMMMTNIKYNTGVFRMRQFIHCKSFVFSKYPLNILINFDLFPKNDNGYFVAYFD